MKKIALILIIGVILLGCSKKQENQRFKIEYQTSEHVFNVLRDTVTFIQGDLPLKTYLESLNLSTTRSRKISFPNHGLYGPYQFFHNPNQLLCASRHIHSNTLKSKLLLVNTEKKPFIANEFLLSENNRVAFISDLSSDQKVFVLFRDSAQYGKAQNKFFLKKFDLIEQTLSPAIFIYDSKLNNALFINNSSFLLMETASYLGELKLILYDLKTEKKIREISLEYPLIELKQDSNSQEVYALVQSVSENRGSVLKIELNTLELKNIAYIPGGVESMQLIENNLLVIARDFSRSVEQKNHWLHPRSLFFINLNEPEIIDSIDWTLRRGKFIGYNYAKNLICYIVTDNDSPAVWLINNTYENLKNIQKIIK